MTRPRKNICWALAVALLSLLPYLQTLKHGWNLDDELTRAPHIAAQGMTRYFSFFSHPYFDDGKGQHYGYRPITLLSFQLERDLLGDHPSISHAINCLLYALLCALSHLLVLGLLREYTNISPLVALGMSLCFALHPIHTEAVASIKNRDELLAFLGCVLAGLSLLAYARNPQRFFYFLLYVLAALFALASKKSALAPLALLPIAATLATKKTINYKSYAFVVIGTGLLIYFFLPTLDAATHFLLCAICMAGWILSYLLQYKREKLFVAISSFQALVFLPGVFLCLGWLYPQQPIFMLLAASSACLLLGLEKQSSIMVLLFQCTLLSAGYLYWSTLLLMLPAVFVLIRLVRHFSKDTFSPSGFSITEKGEVLAGALGLGLVLWTSDANSIGWTILGLLVACFGLVLMLKKSMTWAYLGTGLITTFTFLNYLDDNEIKWLVLLPLPSLLLGLYLLRRAAYVSRFQSGICVLLFLGMYAQLIGHGHTHRPLMKQNKATPPSSNLRLVREEGRSLHAIENPLATKASPTPSPLSPHVSPPYIKAALYTYGRYTQLLLFPYPLRSYYGYQAWNAGKGHEVYVMLSACLHLLMLMGCVVFWRREPMLGFAFLFYLVCLFPFSNAWILVAGGMGERLAFGASWGYALILGLGVAGVWRERGSLQKFVPKKIAIGIALAILSAYGVLSYWRTKAWRDKMTLYQNDLRTTPHSAKLQQLMGEELLLASRKDPQRASWLLPKAEKHFSAALSMYPGPHTHWVSLGITRQLQNNIPEALNAYLRAIELSPYDFQALFQSGVCYEAMGKHAKAIHTYQRCLKEWPEHEGTYTNLSFLFFRMKNYQAAKQISLAATHHFPQKKDHWMNLGRISLAMQDKTASLGYFKHALRFPPPDPHLKNIIKYLENEVRQKEEQKAKPNPR